MSLLGVTSRFKTFFKFITFLLVGGALVSLGNGCSSGFQPFGFSSLDDVNSSNNNGTGSNSNLDLEKNLSVSDSFVKPTDSQITFQLKLQAPLNQDIDLNYRTVSDTAIEGIDFIAKSGTITLPAGITETAIVIEKLVNIRQVDDYELQLEIDFKENGIDKKISAKAVIDYNGNPDPVNKTMLYTNNFEANTVGAYGVNVVNVDWNTPPFTTGVMNGRTSIVTGADALNNGRSLRVLYPLDGVGGTDSGAQWQLRLPNTYNEVYSSYKVKFSANFDFVKGGKLPGLAGGTANTGSRVPNETDGWSARMMWRFGGQAVQYVYHPDQPTNFGQDFRWTGCAADGSCKFEINKWYEVRTRIVMNTPGVKDGIIQSWIDGDLVLNQRDLRFRDIPGLGIDMFYFSTFFGGNDATWAAKADVHIFYDDFQIFTPN